MILFCVLIIPVLYILIRVILYSIVKKNGKFSYDGFSAAGFAYNSEKDIFYSTRNAWQKNFGYTHLYDVAAPIFRMIVDTEPIRFKYNDKNWLITFWKGQYGIVTGAEIGIYCTTEKKVNKKTVYLPVNDNEMLNMDFILYKNNEVISKVKCKHWWLAIFKLGMFSKPKELSMDITLTFLDKEMLAAFLKSFKKLGYKDKHYKVFDNTFCFKYKKPRTRKVWTRTWITDAIRQHLNRKNVELYNKYLEDFIDDNKIDDYRKSNNNLIMVNDLLPDLLKNNSESKIESEAVIDNRTDRKIESKPIKKNISKKSETNIKNIIIRRKKSVIFLDSSVYPRTRVNK